MAFPWLFPGGVGDITDFPEPKNYEKWASFMLYYEDGRFATDKLWCFFAQNFLTRRRNTDSGNYFVNGYYSGCPDNLPDIQDQIKNGNYSIVNNITYFAKAVRGSNHFWMARRSELYSWINYHVEQGNGAPMYFITLSCAEYHWPDIIRLLQDRLRKADRGKDAENLNINSPNLVQLVNEYSIVVQEYFQKRVEAFLETTGKTIFGIKHYWVRYEFTPGRGQIHAHMLCISDDQSIYKHMARDLKQKDGEEKRAIRLATWAKAKIGLNATVGHGFDNLDKNTECKNAISTRFTDVAHLALSEGKDVEIALKKDIDQLKKFCQCHNCSAFCLRKDTHKKQR